MAVNVCVGRASEGAKEVSNLSPAAWLFNGFTSTTPWGGNNATPAYPNQYAHFTCGDFAILQSPVVCLPFQL